MTDALDGKVRKYLGTKGARKASTELLPVQSFAKAESEWPQCKAEDVDTVHTSLNARPTKREEGTKQLQCCPRAPSSPRDVDRTPRLSSAGVSRFSWARWGVASHLITFV